FDIGLDFDGNATNQFANIVIDPDVHISGSNKLIRINSVNSNISSSAMLSIGYGGHGYYIDAGGTIYISRAEVAGAVSDPGARQEIRNTVVAAGGITGDGTVRLSVDGTFIPNAPFNVDFNVTTAIHNTATKIAQAAVQ